MPDYMGFNEKTVINAMVHQNWHPLYRRINKVCDKCKSPDFLVIAEKELQKSEEWDKLQILVLACPVCGNQELNIDGVYFLPKTQIPEAILKWVGSFTVLFCYLYSKMRQIYPDDETESTGIEKGTDGTGTSTSGLRRE